MISKKTYYALKAVLYLSKKSDYTALISEICEQENLPRKFLEAILLELKNKGMLLSKRGKHGGYSLFKKPSSITFGSLIRAMQGPLAPIACVSEMAYSPCKECLDECSCSIRLVMTDLRQAMISILDKVTIEDALNRSLSVKNHSGLHYQI
jgi:hypothetical protein